jgi:hypothetical protein
MSDKRQTEWQGLVDYTGLMLEKAEAGEWEALTQMAVDRQSRLESFFSQPVPAELADLVAAGIQRINDINSMISTLAGKASREFSAEHQVFQKRKQASRAYSDPGNSQR